MRRLKIVTAILLVAFGFWHFRYTILGRLIGNKPMVILIEGLDDGDRRDLIGALFVRESDAGLLVISRDGCVNGHKLNGLYKSDPSMFRSYMSKLLGNPIDAEVRIPFRKLAPFLKQAFPHSLELPQIEYRLKYCDRRASPPFSYDIPASGGQPVVLSAEELQWYLRDRKSDPLRRGEAARVERWRTFLHSAMKELSGSQGIARIPGIVAAARRSFHTDLSTVQGMRIALALARGGKLSVTYAPMTPFRSGKTLFVRLDEGAIKERAKLLLAGICPPEHTTIWVLNGTNEAGLARSTAGDLGRILGVRCQAGNASSASVNHTYVAYNRDSLSDISQHICRHIGAGSPRFEPDKAPFPLLVVTIGLDFHDERR